MVSAYPLAPTHASLRSAKVDMQGDIERPKYGLEGLDSPRGSATSGCLNKGAIVRKVRRRKSIKPPVKEILADKFNFRDVVHQFTGITKTEAASSCDSIHNATNKSLNIKGLEEEEPQFAASTCPPSAAFLAYALVRSLKTLHALSSHVVSNHSSPASSLENNGRGLIEKEPTYEDLGSIPAVTSTKGVTLN